jgi:hypothetical protein
MWTDKRTKFTWLHIKNQQNTVTSRIISQRFRIKNQPFVVYVWHKSKRVKWLETGTSSLRKKANWVYVK